MASFFDPLLAPFDLPTGSQSPLQAGGLTRQDVGGRQLDYSPGTESIINSGISGAEQGLSPVAPPITLPSTPGPGLQVPATGGVSLTGGVLDAIMAQFGGMFD